MPRLPLPDNSVDAVVWTRTIHFVSDLNAAPADIPRVLRPHGRLDRQPRAARWAAAATHPGRELALTPATRGR